MDYQRVITLDPYPKTYNRQTYVASNVQQGGCNYISQNINIHTHSTCQRTPWPISTRKTPTTLTQPHLYNGHWNRSRCRRWNVSSRMVAITTSDHASWTIPIQLQLHRAPVFASSIEVQSGCNSTSRLLRRELGNTFWIANNTKSPRDMGVTNSAIIPWKGTTTVWIATCVVQRPSIHTDSAR